MRESCEKETEQCARENWEEEEEGYNIKQVNKHQCFPAENVAVEANPVFREVEATL